MCGESYSLKNIALLSKQVVFLSIIQENLLILHLQLASGWSDTHSAKMTDVPETSLKFSLLVFNTLLFNFLLF
jgi:hypothetical protein